MENGFDKDGFMSWLKEEFPELLILIGIMIL